MLLLQMHSSASVSVTFSVQLSYVLSMTLCTKHKLIGFESYNITSRHMWQLTIMIEKLAKFTEEQYTIINQSTAGCFDLGFLSIACKLTKTLGLKRPAVDWLIVVYCSSVNFATISTQLWASTASLIESCFYTDIYTTIHTTHSRELVLSLWASSSTLLMVWSSSQQHVESIPIPSRCPRWYHTVLKTLFLHLGSTCQSGGCSSRPCATRVHGSTQHSDYQTIHHCLCQVCWTYVHYGDM